MYLQKGIKISSFQIPSTHEWLWSLLSQNILKFLIFWQLHSKVFIETPHFHHKNMDKGWGCGGVVINHFFLTDRVPWDEWCQITLALVNLYIIYIAYNMAFMSLRIIVIYVLHVLAIINAGFHEEERGTTKIPPQGTQLRPDPWKF